MKSFKDYLWEEGIPKGFNPTEEDLNYKIVMDPYRKHISIEKYQGTLFLCTVYDSRLFDFREIKLGEQLAWQKIPIEETPTQAICLIRNQDDRIVCKEIYTFKENRCVKCEGFSSHEIPLFTQYLTYKDWGDPFSGVVLQDREGKTVLIKEYELTEGRFSTLIQENWKPRSEDLPLRR